MAARVSTSEVLGSNATEVAVVKTARGLLGTAPSSDEILTEKLEGTFELSFDLIYTKPSLMERPALVLNEDATSVPVVGVLVMLKGSVQEVVSFRTRRGIWDATREKIDARRRRTGMMHQL